MSSKRDSYVMSIVDVLNKASEDGYVIFAFETDSDDPLYTGLGDMGLVAIPKNRLDDIDSFRDMLKVAQQGDIPDNVIPFSKVSAKRAEKKYVKEALTGEQKMEWTIVPDFFRDDDSEDDE